MALLYIRHVIEKKKFELTANLKKAYFSDITQKKMVYIVRSTDFRRFEVKDHKRLVLNTIFCCFWDFCNFFNHFTSV